MTESESPGRLSARFDRRPVLRDISIIIPTVGRELLRESLSHIASGSTWPAHLIVIDQSSSDIVAEWIEVLRSAGLNAEHVRSIRRGRAAGINCGLERATSRFVAITDDDCFADSEWLQRMRDHLLRDSGAIVTGRVEPAGDDEAPFCVVRTQVPRIYRRPQVRAQPLIGGNMGVSMINVERVGPFDEHRCVFSAEDRDWGYRALREGIPIIYDPIILVRHFSWRNASQRRVRYQQYARSQGGFYGKYLRRGDSLVALQATRDLVRAPLRWVRGVLKADQELIHSGRADTLDLVPGILAGLRWTEQSVPFRNQIYQKL